MPPSRRHFLRLTAGATAALAGCGAVGDPGVDRPTTRPRRDPVRPLAVVRVRSDSADPLFVSADGEPRGAAHLTDVERVRELTFAGGDAAAPLVAVVEETDFERHSVFLHQHRVGECYRVHLTDVNRRDDRVRASFCRELRDADVGCSRDRQVRVGHAIRLPFPGDDFSGMGVGFGMHCAPGAEDGVATRTEGDG
jgi:hypothetical protein